MSVVGSARARTLITSKVATINHPASFRNQEGATIYGQDTDPRDLCKPIVLTNHLAEYSLYSTTVDGRSRPAEQNDCLDETIVLKYAEGSLTDARAQEVARHADGCVECRELIDWVQRDRAAQAPVDEVKAARPAALVTTVGRDVQHSRDAAGALFAALRRERRDLTGELIAEKYLLRRRLGAGGMGVVYEALNTWTERRVALKLLHPWFSSDDETVERFRQEAKNAGRIHHPSIVEVLDLGHDPRDGSLYLVQELLPGQTLRERLGARGRFSVAEALATLAPILDALDAAHQAGVVHRDVKPENIILSVDRRGAEVPKLIDFGISKITVGELAELWQTGRAMGTPLYMAPEQLRAVELVDGRTDVWAVGVVLFELLAGRRPFGAASAAEVAALVLTTAAPSLLTVAPELPEAIAKVVARALDPDREARFPTMRALLDALTLAAEASATAPAGPEPAVAVVATGEAIASPKQVRQRSFRSGAAVALAAVLVAAVAVVAARHDRSATASASPSLDAQPRAVVGAPVSAVVIDAPLAAPPSSSPSPSTSTSPSAAKQEAAEAIAPSLPAAPANRPPASEKSRKRRPVMAHKAVEPVSAPSSEVAPPLLDP